MLGDDLVHKPVFFRLLRVHDEITLHILRNLLEGLTGVLGEQLIRNLPQAQNLTRLDVNISRLSGEPSSPRLVNQNTGIRKRKPLVRRTGRQDQGRHAGRLPDTNRRNIRAEQTAWCRK